MFLHGAIRDDDISRIKLPVSRHPTDHVAGGRGKTRPNAVSESFVFRHVNNAAIATFFSIIVVLSLLALALTNRRSAAQGEAT